MSPKTRVLLLVAIMAGIAVGVTGITISALYSAAFEQQKARLRETAQSQARMIEAIARHEELGQRRAQGLYPHDDPFTATLETLRQSHEQFHGFGQTGEFTLARRKGDQIDFLLSHRHDDLDNPQSVPFKSSSAEPMRLALSSDERGTIVGLDYRDTRVLAAYEPVKVFDLGIVAKIDLSEIRAPFVRAGMFAAGGAAGLILLGMVAFLRIGNPIVRRLEESEREYRSIIHTAMDGFWIVGTDGRFIDVNRAYCDLTGYSREELLTMGVPDVEVVESAEDTEKHIRQIIEAGYDRFETKHRCKDGRIVDIEVSTTYTGGEQGVLFSFLRDITDRKRAEEALRLERDNLRNVLQAMEDGVYIVDQHENIQYANRVLVEEFGPYEGRKCYEYFHDREEVCPWCKNSDVWAGRTVHWEWHLPKNGKTYDLIDTPLTLPDGSIGKLEIFRDVTERKRAEEALRANETKLRVITESSADYIMLLDRDLRVQFINRTEPGLSFEDVIGKPLDSFVEDGDAPGVRELLQTVLRTGEKDRYETTYHRPDGKAVYFESLVAPLLDGGGEERIVVTSRDVTQRKLAEADLELQRYYLAKSQELGSLGTWNLDIKKNELIWTDENYRVFGVPLGTELTYETFLNCVHPDDRQYVDERFHAALDNEPYDNEPYDIEHRLLVDGKTKWVREKAELEFDENGQCVRATGFTQDITQHKWAEQALKDANDQLESRVVQRTADLTEANEQLSKEIDDRIQAEKALRESEERFRSLSNAAFEGIAITEMGRLVDANIAFTNMFGYALDELVGSDALMLIVPEDHGMATDKVRSGCEEPYELRAIHKDGSVIDLEVCGRNAFYKGRECRITVVRDVTDRKRAEAAMRLNEDRLVALLKISRMEDLGEREFIEFVLEEGVKLTNSRIGFLGFINDDETEMTVPTWSGDAMKQCSVQDKPHRFLIDGGGLWGEAVRQRKPILVNDYEALQPEEKRGYPAGHVPVTRYMGIPVFDGQRIVMVAGVANKDAPYDETDIQQLTLLMTGVWAHVRRRQADQSLSRMTTQLNHVARLSTLGEMVAGIAHEVNQPLYSICNFAKASANVLAAGEIKDLANLRHWNDAINRSATRAGEIIKRLRGFVRRTDSQRTLCEIDELLGEAMQIVAPEAIRQRVAVRLEPTETPSTVHVDRIEIQQVLVNLLQNAYEALGEAEAGRREVIVRIEPGEQFVEVTVADNGPGLPAADDSHIFDTFVTTKQNGMGMGLAIATTIVEAHGGKLWGVSNPDGGATFHFTLPIVREPGAREEEEVDDQ